MKLRLPKFKKIKFSFSIKYLYALVLLATAVIAGYLGLFLHKNFYGTIAQTEQIVLLKKEVAPDTIDTEKVNQVLTAIEQKVTPPEKIDFQSLKNPFRNLGVGPIETAEN